MYQLSHHYLFEGYREKMLSITASVASMLDAELFKTIQTPADERLRPTPTSSGAARCAQRQPAKDTYMKRMFTVCRRSRTPRFSSWRGPRRESSKRRSSGEVYRGGRVDTLNMNRRWRGVFVNDEFGTWLTVPCAHSRSERQARGRRHRRSPRGLGRIEDAADIPQWIARPAPGIWIDVPAVIFVSRRVTRPLMQLRDALEAIGQGKLESA